MNTIIEKFLALTNVESMLLKASKLSSKNTLKGWYIKTLLIPVFLVFVPYFIGLFTSSIVLSLHSILFNGGLSVVGISLLYSTSSYLIQNKINFEEKSSIASKKQKVFECLSTLREKVLNRTLFIILFGALIYIIQIIYVSGKEKILDVDNQFFGLLDFILGFLVFATLFFSVEFSKLNFELSDEFIDESKSYEAIYDHIETQEKNTEELMQELLNKGV